MRYRVRISGGLLACLMLTYSHISTALFLPAAIGRVARQDVWLSTLVGNLFGLLVVWFSSWVALQYPSLGPVQIAKRVLGRFVGTIAALIYIAYFTWLFSLVLRNVLDFSVIVLLIGTPGLAVAVFVGGVALYCVWHGLEPLARIAFPVLVGVVVSNIALPLLLIPRISRLNLAPPLEQGLMPVFHGALFTLQWFGEAFIVMTLVPHLSRPRSVYRWSFLGVAGGGVILAVQALFTNLVLGQDLPSRILYPIYLLVQEIAFGTVVERIEMMVIIVWMAGMFLKMSLALYAAAEGAAQLINLKDHRWTAVALGGAGLLLTQVWPSPLAITRAGSSFLESAIHLAIEVGFPTLLVLGAGVSALFRREGHHA